MSRRTSGIFFRQVSLLSKYNHYYQDQCFILQREQIRHLDQWVGKTQFFTLSQSFGHSICSNVMKHKIEKVISGELFITLSFFSSFLIHAIIFLSFYHLCDNFSFLLSFMWLLAVMPEGKSTLLLLHFLQQNINGIWDSTSSRFSTSSQFLGI